MMVSFCAVLFLTRCLGDEILDLIESVSEGFPTYFYIWRKSLCFIITSPFH